MKKLALVALVLAGCAGPRGKPGTLGPVGPVGPIALPPEILDVAPSVASSGSTIRIRGIWFGGSPVVLADGTPLAIVAVSGSNELWAAGLPAATGSAVELTVESDSGQRSNPFALDVEPAGALRDAAQGGLVDPQGLALDSDGSLLVFDRASGVLRFDPASGVLAPALAPTASLGAPQAGVRGADGLYIADGTRIVRVADDGSVAAMVTGLASSPTAIAIDGAGTLYWVDGGTSIGRRLPDGTIAPSFATVPAASGLTLLGANLYASDPGAGRIHRVSTGGTVTASFATVPAGTRGITNDGVALIACTPDASGQGAVAISAAGTVTPGYAPKHALPGAAPVGCAAGGTTLYSVSVVDGAIESSASGAAWKETASSLFREGGVGTFAGERLFLDERTRCAAGGTGAVVESLDGGISRLALGGVCAVALGAGSTGVLAVSTSGAAVEIPLAGGAPSSFGISGSGIVQAAALAEDGSIFAARSGPVVHDSPGGAQLSADVAGGIPVPETGLAITSGALYVAAADRIVRVPIDAAGNTGTPQEVITPSDGFLGVRAVVSSPGGAIFVDGPDAFLLDPSGGIHWLADVGTAGVSFTPYGELLLLVSGSYPRAELL